MILINCLFVFIATVMPKVCLMGKSCPSLNNPFSESAARNSLYIVYSVSGGERQASGDAGGELDRKKLSKNITPEYLIQMITATCSTEVIHH